MMSRRYRKRERKKNFLAVLAVVLFGIAVFSINSIGKFIAQNIISPLVSPTGTSSFSLDEITVYGVGKPSDDKAKEEILALSGAGSIVSDFVLFSCFNEEDEASRAAEGTSLEVIPFSAPALSVRLKGQEDKTGAVEDGINLLKENLSVTLDSSNKFSCREISKSELLSCAKTQTEKTEKCLDLLKSSKETSGVDSLYSSLSASADAFAEFSSSDDLLVGSRLLACRILREYLAFCSAVD